MQQDIKNVLYCTDLSKNSYVAFGYAAYLAKLTKADLHLLHVLEPLSDDAVFTFQAFVQDKKKRHEFIDHRIQNARAVLDERQEAFWAAQSAEDHLLVLFSPRKEAKTLFRGDCKSGGSPSLNPQLGPSFPATLPEAIE